MRGVNPRSPQFSQEALESEAEVGSEAEHDLALADELFVALEILALGLGAAAAAGAGAVVVAEAGAVAG